MAISHCVYALLSGLLGVSLASPRYEDCFGRIADVSVETPVARRAILVLGNTGSGKTTLTQLLAGDGKGLMAREVEPNTGEYIIEDVDEKISSKMESKTVVPERLMLGADTSLWDCPGFEDNRGTCVDIASAYLLRHVIGRAAAVKVVVVVNFPSVQVGMDRNDFLDVLRHTTSTIRKVAKYADSLLLVVSKVPNEAVQREGQLTVLSDADVRRKVAAFLEQAKRELQHDGRSSLQPQFREDASRILSVLLQRDEQGDYPRIGLLRRPNASGPVASIPLLQEARLLLRQRLERVGTFTAVDEADFGYALSAQSRHDVRLFVSQINADMASAAQSVAADVVRIAAGDDADFEGLEAAKEIAELLDRVIEDLEKLRDPGHSLESLQEACQSTGLVSATLAGASRMQRAAAALSFLHEVAGRGLGETPQHWIAPLRGAAEELRARRVWHDMLSDLQERLTDYEVQRDPARFLVDKCGISSGRGVQSIPDMKRVWSNLDMSVDHLATTPASVTDQRIETFNQILRSTLDSSHRQSHCTVHGVYVTLSKVDLSLLSWCSIIRIWALDTLYVDEDLKFAGLARTVVILAPRWVVVGFREIDLDGANGRDGPQISLWEQLQSIMPGSRGVDGSPGEHGQPAGQLFALGTAFVNASNLWVHGRGGAGGSGSNGMDGRGSGWLPFLAGGRGGDGGAPGLGGKAGTIDIRMLGGTGDAGIRVTVTDGRPGRDGRGGRGGDGVYGEAPAGETGVSRKGEKFNRMPTLWTNIDNAAEFIAFRSFGVKESTLMHPLTRRRFLSMKGLVEVKG